MGISAKLTLAFVSAGLLLFGSYGLMMIRSEAGELQSAAAREMNKLGHLLQVAVENGLRDRQIEDVVETLERIEQIDERVRVRITDLDGQVISSTSEASLESRVENASYRNPEGLSSQQRLRPERMAVSEREHSILLQSLRSKSAVLRFDPIDDPRVLYFATPLLSEDGAAVGGLLVWRSLEEMQSDIASTSRWIQLTVLLFVATISVLGLGLGASYVSRPLRRLSQAMQRVCEGDYGVAIDLRRDDEVGALAQSFNTMLSELQAARQRLLEEEESRRELQAALQRADKLITLGQLSAGLAHEIGSPLQILHGRASALAKRPNDPERTKRVAEILVTQCERISRIVQRLLDWARRRPTVRARADVSLLARGVVDLLEVESRRHKVRLVLDAPPLFFDSVDADALQQLLFNLLSNALRAAPGGNVRASLALEKRRMASSEDEVQVLAIRVRDDGIGMTEDVRAKIFEPFFTTRSEDGGSGLGLAVLKSIVDEHQGSVEVHSQTGRGSLFEIYLPCTALV